MTLAFPTLQKEPIPASRNPFASMESLDRQKKPVQKLFLA